MTTRFWLVAVAAGLLLGSFALSTYDRITTAVMVGCLKDRFGKEGAPVHDLPECAAAWDPKLGHRATRALVADAAGPFGALQASSMMSWACAVALFLLVVGMGAQRPRSATHWGVAAGAGLLALAFLAAYWLALGATEAGTPDAWFAAERRFKAITWLPIAAGVLASIDAAHSRAAGRSSG